MCIFQKSIFLCGCDKLKISQACSSTSLNAQGDVFCQNDPHAHIDDGVPREYDVAAYGPGVCCNIHCRWRYSLLPLGVYGQDSKQSLLENDAPFDMSEAACTEREDRWFRLLSADQQLECLSMTFPLPVETMSTYAQAHFNSDPVHSTEVLFSEAEIKPDELRWFELNPRYMTAQQLQHATGYLLPANITVPSTTSADGTTPLKPYAGPFKVGAHTCKPRFGICRRCGENNGSRKVRDEMIAHNVMTSRVRPTRPHLVQDMSVGCENQESLEAQYAKDDPQQLDTVHHSLPVLEHGGVALQNTSKVCTDVSEPDGNIVAECEMEIDFD